jgi:hypothetical protein
MVFLCLQANADNIFQFKAAPTRFSWGPPDFNESKLKAPAVKVKLRLQVMQLHVHNVKK